jgi:hypothetical protein
MELIDGNAIAAEIAAALKACRMRRALEPQSP